MKGLARIEFVVLHGAPGSPARLLCHIQGLGVVREELVYISLGPPVI